MNGKITAEKFASTFCEAAKKYSESYHNNSAWTDVVLKHGGIIDKIVRECEMTYCREYYNIDAIGWSDAKNNKFISDCKKVGLRPELWNLEVAIEHENSKTLWLDEVCKLAYINCPLRVVIAYSPKESDDNAITDNVKTILESTNALREGQEFLLMLGDCGRDSQPDYRSYVFYYDNTSKSIKRNPA